MLELEFGVHMMARKADSQGSLLRDWLNQTRAQFSGRILAFDEATIDRCAPLYVPNPRSFRDSMMAATALAHDRTMVTRNVAYFRGVAVVNPFE